MQLSPRSTSPIATSAHSGGLKEAPETKSSKVPQGSTALSAQLDAEDYTDDTDYDKDHYQIALSLFSFSLEFSRRAGPEPPEMQSTGEKTIGYTRHFSLSEIAFECSFEYILGKFAFKCVDMMLCSVPFSPNTP